VPFLVRWPGVTKPGSVSDTPSAHVDLFPTFLQLAGGKAPGQALDRESLVALLRAPGSRLRRNAVFQHSPGYLGAGEDADGARRLAERNEKSSKPRDGRSGAGR
jgi:arylsulfatase A-like enzyme